MQTTDLIDALKTRLQARQKKASDSLIYRTELDALWECVEVLAQIVDGKRDVLVPDYHSDPKRLLPTTVHIESPK